MTDAERVQAVLETACRQGRADKVAQGVAAMEAAYLDTIGTRLRDNPDTESRLMLDDDHDKAFWFEVWREARRELPAKPFRQ